MKEHFYKWLQNNLKNYKFDKASKDENKKELTRNLNEHPITEQSYDNFVECFENNIFLYHVDLENDKYIFSDRLDCYFIDTYAGKTPIEYYKSIRPVETALLTKEYIKKSKIHTARKTYLKLNNWTVRLKNITANFTQRTEKKHYTFKKSILTLLTALSAFGMTAVAVFLSKAFYIDFEFLDNTDLEILPCLARAEADQINTFAVLMIILLILLLIFIVFNILETKQLIQNKFISKFLNKSKIQVNEIKLDISEDVDNLSNLLFDAAERGNDLNIPKSKKIKKKNKFERKLKKTERRISKKRIYIPIPITIILVVITLLLPICFTDIIPKLDIELTYQNANKPLQNKNNYSSPKTSSTLKPETDKPVPETPTPTQVPSTPTPTVKPSQSPIPTAKVENADIYSESDIVNENVCPTLPTDTVIASPAYSTYHDNDFGFDLDFPAHFEELKTDVDSNNVQRCIYTSEDHSAILKINAGYNRGNITPQELSERLKCLYYGDVTYNPVTNNWFAITITNGNRSFYAYYKWSEGMIRGFEFYYYGLENADTYNKYINDIYSSFKNNSYFIKKNVKD